jgi:MFS family permease
MSIYLAVLLGGAPIGAPFAGWVADTLGARAALGVGAASGAVGFLIGVVWMMTAKNLRVRYVRRSRRFVRLSYDGRGGPAQS